MREITLAQYSRLVGLLYDVDADQVRWQAYLSELSTVFDGVRFVFKGHDLRTNVNIAVLSASYDPDFVRSYEQFYAARNPWISIQSQIPLGVACQPEEWLPHDELAKTEFYNDWLKPQGIDTAAGIVLHRDEQTLFALSGDFGNRQADGVQRRMLDLITLLAPHMYRAFSLTRRIASLEAREVFRGHYDGSGDAVFLLDAEGFVIQANGRGEGLRRQLDLLKLDLTGRLKFADPAAQSKLDRALFAIESHAYDDLPGPFTVPGNGALWSAIVTPYRNSAASDWLGYRFSAQSPAAIIHLSPPDPLRLFATRCHLTAAELSLVRGLYGGQSLHEIAATKGVSINTVRNQLKTVFDKTGSHRQAELVAAIRQAVAIDGP